MNHTSDDLRAVAIHVAVTVGFTIGLGVVALASARPLETVLISAAPLVALIGAIAMLSRTYRVWRRGGRWQVWQGGAWLLLAFFVVALFSTAPALIS